MIMWDVDVKMSSLFWLLVYIFIRHFWLAFISINKQTVRRYCATAKWKVKMRIYIYMDEVQFPTTRGVSSFLLLFKCAYFGNNIIIDVYVRCIVIL